MMEPRSITHPSDAARSCEAETLRVELRALVLPVVAVCGPDSAAARLLHRGLRGPRNDAELTLRRMRMARFAVDQLPVPMRRRIAAGAMSSAARASLAPPTILVAVPESFAGSSGVATLVATLEQEGYDVRNVADGLAAFAEIRRDPPTLAIIDVLLPPGGGMDGVELVGAALRLEIPVVTLCSIPVRDAPDGMTFVPRSGDHMELLAAVARLSVATL